MALSASIIWEVRAPTGNDNNGGGFRAGATGTDYSQQDSPQVVYTDLTVDGVTNTKVTSAGTPFTAAHVGNLINITSGAGWTVGRYEVMSVAAGVATLDRSPAAITTGGGNGNLGGALASLVTLGLNFVFSNTAFCKGPFTQTASATFAATATPSSTAPHCRLIGYQTTRTDGLMATITLSTTAGLKALNVGAGYLIQNFLIDCASVATSTGIACTTFCEITKNLVKGYVSNGITTGQNSSVSENEIGPSPSAASSSCGILLGGQQAVATYNYVHENTGMGIQGLQGAKMDWNLVVLNTGAASDGLNLNGGGCSASNNTVHGNGRDGIRIQQNASYPGPIKNNLLTGNAGYGFNFSSGAGTPAQRLWDGNAYGITTANVLNTLGSRNNLDDIATNPQNGVAPYTNVLDITFSVDPYTNRAGKDFTLNSTTGGGALLRSSGFPGAIPGATGAGKPDFGVFRHQDPASGGGSSTTGRITILG